MNLKQLGILIALVIVIGGAGLMLHNRQKSSWTGGGADVGKKLMGDKFPVNDVARISVQHGTNALNLVNPQNFSGVRTSPFFGRATSAAAARRLIVGTRVFF